MKTFQFLALLCLGSLTLVEMKYEKGDSDGKGDTKGDTKGGDDSSKKGSEKIGITSTGSKPARKLNLMPTEIKSIKSLRND